MRPILDCKKWPKILWFGPKKGCFRPKIALAAENNTFGRNFSYGRNFGYGRISDFSKPFLAVTVFRQKFSFGHTLEWMHAPCWVEHVCGFLLFNSKYRDVHGLILGLCVCVCVCVCVCCVEFEYYRSWWIFRLGLVAHIGRYGYNRRIMPYRLLIGISANNL